MDRFLETGVVVFLLKTCGKRRIGCLVRKIRIQQDGVPLPSAAVPAVVQEDVQPFHAGGQVRHVRGQQQLLDDLAFGRCLQRLVQAVFHQAGLVGRTARASVKVVDHEA